MKVFSETAPRFRYTEPAPLNTKLLLLTHDNQCVVGVWKGPALDGQPAPAGTRPPGSFKAWAGLPERNKEVEQTLGWL
jgi:hypothetical protein